MTRQQKIRKLANAIRAYRGIHNGHKDYKWITPPNKHKITSISKYCAELKLDFTALMARVDGLKSFLEFDAMIKEL